MNSNGCTLMGTRGWLVGIAVIVAIVTITGTASAQSGTNSSSKTTAPPQNWVEKFSGLYGDSENRVPPGFPPYSTLHPFRSFDSYIAPFLQPWAARRQEDTNFEVEESGAYCRPTGLIMAHQNRGFQLVVSPGRITSIGTELPARAIRRIYLNRDHLKNPPLTSLGDSVAHWDGDTLVIDTIGFDDKSFLSLEGARHSTELHIIERWRFVADGKWLEKVWIVDDPRAFKAPFTFTRYHEKLPAGTRARSEMCLSFQGWRDWVTLHNEAVVAEAEQRAAAAKALAEKKK